ncbi:2-phospho-L-lactate guanylyltransferase [Halopiger djelfimassiliensis]|uniref:2-phospho-L-lactate guanylyltransferase n=1 Tax=Halopiger djelfimassiliensis TaxID=1293047 RepID=UPI000677B7CC|nr:2-phospho-L-lactate guanylyltransferase [Halopiger djelfimassiliensis]
MQIVVPFAADTPKTRLASRLAPAERSAFARAMLEDVLDAIAETGHEPTVLSTAPIEFGDDVSGSVSVDDAPLTEAVNAVLAAADESVAVVMADLALATPAALERLFNTDAGVAIAPGRGGGTNALVARDPAFRVDYHGTSYLDHRETARDIGADLVTIDSFRLATDIDEPSDLVEVLIHGGDRAPACLREFGFELEETGGRVDVTRH